MSEGIQRITAGYRTLFFGGGRLLAGAGLLLLVAAIITIPLWWLSSHLPRLFDALVLGTILIAIVVLFTGRLRRKKAGSIGTVRRKAARFLIPAIGSVSSVLMIIFAIAGVWTGMIIAALILSTALAWRVGSI